MNIQSIATPKWFRERTPDAPSTLWVRGDPEIVFDLARHRLAVVGARACSSYGRAIARGWAQELAHRGFDIVSGLARGIDGAAHYGALESVGAGTTIAVLGCGIDRDYPAAHGELAQRIVDEGGAIVSEYEPGVEPAPWRFPARNRIIAGLSTVCLVVEARERSGALITVDFALECGSTVLAVPGEVTSLLSEGTNKLIRDGHARAVLTPEDVVSWFAPVVA